MPPSTSLPNAGLISLGVLQISTPNEHADRMINVWNPYQCMATFNLSRSASLFETGLGRGMGFRDSNQDLLGFVHMVPDRARQRILDIAATQLPSGGAYHQYQPLTKRGNDAIGSGFNDDPLWLILAVAAYLKETGDGGILDEQVPFDNEPGSESSLVRAPAALDAYTLDRLGPHRLPLIGRADWNDCLNLNCFSTTPGESFQTTENREGGVAESVFIAGLFTLAADELAKIAHHYGRQRRRRSATSAARDDMAAAVLAHGWDGAVVPPRLRLLRGAGWVALTTPKVRSTSNRRACVSWPASVLDDDKARLALESVATRLATDHGIMLVQPAYTSYHVELGEISSYPPGYKENGSVFCHTNPWVMIAETRVGNGDRAFDYYLRINPSAREQLSDVHRCEPYVYAQMIAGSDAPTHGEAKNSWLTGTAAWNLVALSQHILGIRPRSRRTARRPPASPPTGRASMSSAGSAEPPITSLSARHEGNGPSRQPRRRRRADRGKPVPPAAGGATVTVEAVLED